ncbi:MAG: phospholipid carrier-dependent glycosyltransferase [Leptolyngbyaceae cyanobacterium CSU_1_4]|nr:phospholipid carrier-dependent glycosyltransferase [Leptolyngbyaceae cyanobacterium CSU_1_4]
MDKVRETVWVLPTILLIGVIVRVWGLNFGLPHTECRPDETAMISRALGFFSGDLNPHFFIYPTLYMYVLFGVYAAYYGIGHLLGTYSSTDDLIREFIYDPSHLYLINRYVSASFGVMTIAVVYLMIQRLVNRQTAAIASLFLSLAYLHVRNSHFGVTDVAQTFLIVTAVLFILRSSEASQPAKIAFQNYLYAGIFSGLAFSTKYTSLPLIGTLLVAHSLKVIQERKDWKDKIIDNRNLIRLTQGGLVLIGTILLVGAIALTPEFVTQSLTVDGKLENAERLPALQKILGILGGASLGLPILMQVFRFFGALLEPNLYTFWGGFLGAFFMGTPFALLAPKAFVGEFSSVIHAAAQATHGYYLGTGFGYHFQFTLPLGLGWGLLIAALLGIMAAFKFNVIQSTIVLTFPVTYYLLMGNSFVVPSRYMIPVIPFACMTAAIVVTLLVEQVSQWQLLNQFPIRSPEKFLALLLTTLIIFPSATAIAQSDRLLATPDNRLEAAAWLRQNAPQNSSIYQTGLLYGQVLVDRSLRQVLEHLKSPQINGAKSLIAQLLSMQNDETEPYPQWDYDSSKGEFYFAQKPQKGLPDYIIVQKNAVDSEEILETSIAEIIQKFYGLKRSFQAMEIGNPQNRFDQQDAFYLPFSGFKNVRRPGTNLYIYQIISSNQ